MTSTRGDTATSEERIRSVEQEIEIDAPLSAVWKALTEASELVRWLPMETRVKPGSGGSIWLRWEDEYEAESRIEIWEPESHLRLTFPIHGSTEFATDYFLRSRAGGGGTVLRVVTSGFGVGTFGTFNSKTSRPGGRSSCADCGITSSIIAVRIEWWRGRALGTPVTAGKPGPASRDPAVGSALRAWTALRLGNRTSPRQKPVRLLASSKCGTHRGNSSELSMDGTTRCSA